MRSYFWILKENKYHTNHHNISHIISHKGTKEYTILI